MTTLAPAQVTVDLPTLRESQFAIAKNPARFRVVCCGRRWGKGVLGIVESIREAGKGGRVWWVAPTYSIALEGWTYLLDLLMDYPGRKIMTSRLRVAFPGGGSIEIKTADKPDHLRGAGLDLVVLDEAASMKPEVWELVLGPTLAANQGKALFISTPKHYNWFFDLFERGQSPEWSDWASWQFPTWDNPLVTSKEIDMWQRTMEPGDFDQEYGASFTAIGGAIFPLLSANRPMYLRPMPPGIELRRTGIGMDWGTTKQHNAAVVCGSMTSSGAVWIRSAWLSDTGDDNAWFDEANRCRRDYKAAFARVDRSQSSARGRLASFGYEAETGVADVEARVGAYQGLIRRQAIFFDLNGPGVRDYYAHLCEYHRDPETNKPVEERDDDVDAGGYLLKELTDPQASLPAKAEFEKRSKPAQVGFRGLN